MLLSIIYQRTSTPDTVSFSKPIHTKPTARTVKNALASTETLANSEWTIYWYRNTHALVINRKHKKLYVFKARNKKLVRDEMDVYRLEYMTN